MEEIPPNRIPAECEHITPEMLPLIALNQEQIERIVAQVPRNAERTGHLPTCAVAGRRSSSITCSPDKGDPYLLPALVAFDSRERLDRHLGAPQSVIDRHDILRTGVLWEGLL